MRRVLLLLALTFSLTLSFTSCKGEHKEAEHNEHSETHHSDAANDADLALNFEYQCPMDCEEGKTYEEEGECPKCKMALKKIDKADDEGDNDEGHSSDHDGTSDQ